MKTNSFTLYTVYARHVQVFLPMTGSPNTKSHCQVTLLSVGGISALDQSNCEIVLLLFLWGKGAILFTVASFTFKHILTSAIILSIKCIPRRKVIFFSEIHDCLFSDLVVVVLWTCECIG